MEIQGDFTEERVKRLSREFSAVFAEGGETELDQDLCTMRLRKGHRIELVGVLPNGVYVFRGFYNRRYLSKTKPPVE